MKETGFGAIETLLVLLPGFFCARVVRYLCVKEDQSEFDKVVQGLLYSFIIYVAFATLALPFPLVIDAKVTGENTQYSVHTRVGSLLTLAGLALVLAVLTAALENNDFLGKILRGVRVTQKSARASVWSDVFHSVGGYVQVELSDGRNILGWLRLYSDSPDESSLFLEDASWIGTNNEVIRIKGPGIFLTRESGIRTIMFLEAETLRPASVVRHADRDLMDGP